MTTTSPPTLAQTDNQPAAVPLTELLVGVPKDARYIWTEPDGLKATHYQPVGRYCHEAAETIATLHSQIDGLMKRLLKSEANEKLVRFALWAISEHRDNECADIDGCSIQEKLTELGILVERQMTQSCGEHCVCMEFGEQDEWSCYFLSDEVMAVKVAMASQGGGDG